MHYCEHHDSSREVVKVGGQQESDNSNNPQETSRRPCLKKLRNKVEAAVVVQYLHYCHCCQQEKHYFTTITNIFKEDIIRNEKFYIGTSRFGTGKESGVFLRMQIGHEVCSVTDVKHQPMVPANIATAALFTLVIVSVARRT